MTLYPIGTQDFAKLRNGGFTYVDKTALIYKMVKEGTVYFLSRPRRFGKSLLVSTLKYYFQGRQELFRGLAMEQLEQEWQAYPVFHLDFSRGDFTRPGYLHELLSEHLTQWESLYGQRTKAENPALRFANVLASAHEKTGKPAVVLVDEYDKPLLDVLDTAFSGEREGTKINLEEEHRLALKEFYSVFKGSDPDLRFVLLTGVTKFSQISIFSGFNQPDDITCSVKYDTLCGITEEEMLHYFQEGIAEMAQVYDTQPEVIHSRLKAQYDGYHFSRRLKDVYNPFSLLCAFSNSSLDDFWFRTGTPTYLLRLLSQSQQNLMDLAGRYYEAAAFADCKADVEQLLPMMYQSGYFTIKDFEPRTGLYLLDFPNNEVARGFLIAATGNYLQPKEGLAGTCLLRLSDALSRNDLQTFRTELSALFAGASYRLRAGLDEAGREAYFQYGFYLVLRMLTTFTVEVERETSHGRIDCVVQTPTHTYVIEIKRDHSAQAALRQIDAMDYPAPYRASGKKIVKVGINFSSKSGTIDDFLAEEEA